MGQGPDLPTVAARDRARWRRWLERNHQRARGAWLVRPKKGSTRPSVGYEEAVEEALCFGWIDGKIRPVDEEHALQLFTPRRPTSTWAASNKRRVAALQRAGLMTPAGLAAIKIAKQNGSWSALDDIDAMVMPPDLGRALARNARAKRNYDALSPSSKKVFLAWVAGAKRNETRARRVAATVRLCAENIKLQDSTPEQRATT